MKFFGKIVIIIGGGCDIGVVVVCKFLFEGVNVVISYFESFKGVDEVVVQIEGVGGKVIVV